MFTLPKTATDDDLRDGVREWFRIVANESIADAELFLDSDSPDAMPVVQFIERVSELTDGGRMSAPPAIDEFPKNLTVDDIPLDGPSDIVCRWIPGPNTTDKYLGFVADILHTIPVNGEWSKCDASFFVRSKNDCLSLQLRDIVILED